MAFLDSVRQVSLLASLAITCSVQAAEVAGVTIGDKVRLGTSELVLNGEVRGKIPGSGLARALLKVWLGDRPVDAFLKQALLGS